MTSPEVSSSAMLAERSRSSRAILASPYSDASLDIITRASDAILSGNRASSALRVTISSSSRSEYRLNLTTLDLRKVDMEASSSRESRGSWDIMIRDTGAAFSLWGRVSRYTRSVVPLFSNTSTSSRTTTRGRRLAVRWDERVLTMSSTENPLEGYPGSNSRIILCRTPDSEVLRQFTDTVSAGLPAPAM